MMIIWNLLEIAHHACCCISDQLDFLECLRINQPAHISLTADLSSPAMCLYSKWMSVGKVMLVSEGMERGWECIGTQLYLEKGLWNMHWHLNYLQSPKDGLCMHDINNQNPHIFFMGAPMQYDIFLWTDEVLHHLPAFVILSILIFEDEIMTIPSLGIFFQHHKYNGCVIVHMEV